MRHTIRDIFIWLVSILGITSLYASRMYKRGPLVRVISFHDVSETEWFESVLSFLTENCNVITPDQFHKKDFDSEKINILLTFDDGYQSWIDVVLPLLQQYELKGLFFVCSGLLDIAEDQDAVDVFVKEHLRILPKKVLTWSGAEELVAKGHAIGGHTSHHRDLTLLESEVLEKEIQQDKVTIEQKLSISLKDFAYPYGTKDHHTSSIQKRVVDAGYWYIYTAESRFMDKDMLSIPRTLLEKEQPIPSIKRWIKGGYDVFCMIKPQ